MALHESYHDCPNWIAVGCICKPQEKASAPPAPERDIAQTAERAMEGTVPRQPTAAMIRAAAKVNLSMPDCMPLYQREIEQLWQAMFDAALAESVQPVQQDASVSCGSADDLEKK